MAPRKTEPRAIRPGSVLRVSAEEIARRWGISERRVRKLCQERRIFAARKIDGVWMIPVTAVRPVELCLFLVSLLLLRKTNISPIAVLLLSAAAGTLLYLFL